MKSIVKVTFLYLLYTITYYIIKIALYVIIYCIIKITVYILWLYMLCLPLMVPDFHFHKVLTKFVLNIYILKRIMFYKNLLNMFKNISKFTLIKILLSKLKSSENLIMEWLKFDNIYFCVCLFLEKPI